MFWGLSPALDLLDLYKTTTSTSPPQRLNILLVGGADGRHVLKTMARRYRHHHSIQLNFFIAEASMETLAKQLLLLNIALQPAMGLAPKTKLFMELYGNTLLRPSVAKFLTSTARELVKMVTDPDHLHHMMPIITMDIKYKERDHLENVLKFWCSKDEFNICDSWDRRLRKSLGPRYDTRLGVFDWDLHMRLHSIGGRQVCNQEYRNFRARGVAFSWLESEVSKPNRSMVCVVVPNGEGFLHYGYLGEMVTGPFVAYGLDCEDKDFTKSNQGQNVYRATDVTERNLSQILYEIEHQKEYQHRPVNELKMGPVLMQQGERCVVDTKGGVGGGRIDRSVRVEGVNIKFISVALLALMQYKTEYRDLFDVVYFGAFYTKYLNGELINHVVSKGGLVLVENQKYVLSHREKELKEYEKEVMKALEGAAVECKSFDACTDDFAIFVKC